MSISKFEATSPVEQSVALLKETKDLREVYVVHHQPARLTIALAVGGDGRVCYGYAFASRKDQWSRKLGRTIATGRAIKALMEPRGNLFYGDSTFINSMQYIRVSSPINARRLHGVVRQIGEQLSHLRGDHRFLTSRWVVIDPDRIF